ncbi:hypothetical protein CHU98_g2820 [Xylaria longipes]|nr:hypothetical protein CHU98_g2820 [Xylaria longipes]
MTADPPRETTHINLTASILLGKFEIQYAVSNNGIFATLHAISSRITCLPIMAEDTELIPRPVGVSTETDPRKLGKVLGDGHLAKLVSPYLKLATHHQYSVCAYDTKRLGLQAYIVIALLRIWDIGSYSMLGETHKPNACIDEKLRHCKLLKDTDYLYDGDQLGDRPNKHPCPDLGSSPRLGVNMTADCRWIWLRYSVVNALATFVITDMALAWDKRGAYAVLQHADLYSPPHRRLARSARHIVQQGVNDATDLTKLVSWGRKYAHCVDGRCKYMSTNSFGLPSRITIGRCYHEDTQDREHGRGSRSRDKTPNGSLLSRTTAGLHIAHKVVLFSSMHLSTPSLQDKLLRVVQVNAAFESR